MKQHEWQVYEDAGGGWRLRLVSRNGRIVLVGEAYTRRRDATRALRRASVIAREAVVSLES